MSFIRYRQPIVTRLSPHQGNRQYMVPNLPPLGPELVPDPYFTTWDGAAQPNDFPVGWVLDLPDVDDYFSDAAPGCRLVSNGPQTISITTNVIVVGETHRVEYEYSDKTLPAIAFRSGASGASVELTADVGVRTRFDHVADGADIRLVRWGNNADSTLVYFSVRKVQRK